MYHPVSYLNTSIDMMYMFNSYYVYVVHSIMFPILILIGEML